MDDQNWSQWGHLDSFSPHSSGFSGFFQDSFGILSGFLGFWQVWSILWPSHKIISTLISIVSSILKDSQGFSKDSSGFSQDSFRILGILASSEHLVTIPRDDFVINFNILYIAGNFQDSFRILGILAVTIPQDEYNSQPNRNWNEVIERFGNVAYTAQFQMQWNNQ